MANHICVGSISGSGHAEQILLVGWMEKHNRTVVTFFNPVGNTWNSIDGDKIIHLITALSKVCCKLLKGLRTVTVGPHTTEIPGGFWTPKVSPAAKSTPCLVCSSDSSYTSQSFGRYSLNPSSKGTQVPAKLTFS